MQYKAVISFGLWSTWSFLKKRQVEEIRSLNGCLNVGRVVKTSRTLNVVRVACGKRCGWTPTMMTLLNCLRRSRPQWWSGHLAQSTVANADFGIWRFLTDYQLHDFSTANQCFRLWHLLSIFDWNFKDIIIIIIISICSFLPANW